MTRTSPLSVNLATTFSSQADAEKAASCYGVPLTPGATVYVHEETPGVWSLGIRNAAPLIGIPAREGVR